jgi:hypothetical protein
MPSLISVTVDVEIRGDFRFLRDKDPHFRWIAAGAR